MDLNPPPPKKDKTSISAKIVSSRTHTGNFSSSCTRTSLKNVKVHFFQLNEGTTRVKRDRRKMEGINSSIFFYSHEGQSGETYESTMEKSQKYHWPVLFQLKW